MKTQIISIGNELLIGDTVNTNAARMAELLSPLGCKVTKIISIADDKKEIQDTVKECMRESDLVLCTGGLGPTHDDITKDAVAELFNCRMVENEEVLHFVQSRMAKLNITMTASNIAQALVPENCEVLFNTKGSAPGMWFYENNCYLAVLPGVPEEMEYLMTEKIIPKLMDVAPQLDYLHTVYIQTAGIGESTLSDEVLGDLNQYLNEDVSLAFLPFAGGVKMRITATGKNKEEAVENSRPLYNYIYDKAGDYIYGEGRDYHLAEEVGKLLKEKKVMIATAESCTGGMLSNMITNISGSAEYFKGGVIAYENQVKLEQLGVDEHQLAKHGAVSKIVALQMAKGVAKNLKAEIGISTTGIAGPKGGSREKPVGTVWIGFYSPEKHFAFKIIFSFDRLQNKERSSMVALEVVRRVLKGISGMPYGVKIQSA